MTGKHPRVSEFSDVKVRPRGAAGRPKPSDIIGRFAPDPKEPVAAAVPSRPSARFFAWTFVCAGAAAVAVFFVLNASGRAELDRRAVEELERVRGAVQGDGELFGRLGAEPGIGGALERFGGMFEAVTGASRDIYDLSARFAVLADRLRRLTGFWPGIIFGEDGDPLAELEAVRSDVRALAEMTGRVSALEGVRKLFPPSQNLSLQIELNRAESFLDALLSWLSADAERHVAVLLMNTSELRPGGGFLGSYAEVTLQKGRVTEVFVRDVNESDRELEKNIVPPMPLWPVVKRWRAADANWFFDFASSSAKTLEFLEASELYRRNGLRFDAVVAITPRVVSDILALTGPVPLASSTPAIDADNFIHRIQSEVQKGLSEKDAAPKAILRELSERLMPRLAALGGTEAMRVLGSARDWISEKDLMAFSVTGELQGLLEAYGVSGRVWREPQSWNGDYLAVVAANVGGEKTDLFMKQAVHVQSRIDLDGTVSDRVTVSREHKGKSASEWWYRAPNIAYLQAFTPAGARLAGASGFWVRKILPPLDYEQEEFAHDPDVAAIEDSAVTFSDYLGVGGEKAFGKNVFTGWMKTEPGKTSTSTLEYAHRLLTPPVDGGEYQVIVEKQSGSTGSYAVEIQAPVGFRFKENGTPVFEFETDDLPGRLVVTLTFEKVP